MGILDKINGPGDIRQLPLSELPALADETRAALISKLSSTGGHVASNLGVVEMTVALHYVFSSPRDKIVWDVSHQCYPHKILTGRKAAYLDPAHYSEVTGFTNPLESEHDLFTIGHTATSIPLALGLAKARDAFGGSENPYVCWQGNRRQRYHVCFCREFVYADLATLQDRYVHTQCEDIEASRGAIDGMFLPPL